MKKISFFLPQSVYSCEEDAITIKFFYLLETIEVFQVHDMNVTTSRVYYLYRPESEIRSAVLLHYLKL